MFTLFSYKASAKIQHPDTTKEEISVQRDLKLRVLFIIKRWMIHSLDDLLETSRSDTLMQFMKQLDQSGSKDQYDSLSRAYMLALRQVCPSYRFFF